MKPERLAYLRQISETYVRLGDTEFTATGEDVLQLLDEREALLDALKELSLRIHDPDVHISGDGASHLMLVYAIQEADAAIAKAEAE